MKLITFKYKCNTTFSHEHCDLYDDLWKYGDLNEKIFYKDFKYEGWDK